MTNEELDAATKGWRTHPDPQHEETFADTERKLREIITTLRAQLARREEMHDCAMKERDDTTLYADEQKARADRAEAQLAEAQDRLAHEMACLDGADRRSARLGNLLQDANARADRAEAALAALIQVSASQNDKKEG